MAVLRATRRFCFVGIRSQMANIGGACLLVYLFVYFFGWVADSCLLGLFG
jgi:hypothetical protein